MSYKLGVDVVGGKKKKAVAVQELKRLIKKAEKKKRKFAGYKATLVFDFAGTKVITKVRYETIKAERLVKTVTRALDGRLVRWKKVGPPSKYAYVDTKGNIVPKDMVRTYQILPSGVEQVISAFARTNELKPYKYVDKSVLDEFLPSSFVAVWGGPELREVAEELTKSNKVGVLKFSHGRGYKAYHGFMYPVVRGKEFYIEIMLSESVKKTDRWMPAVGKPKEVIKEPTIPEI